jgi:hypothetical protein
VKQLRRFGITAAMTILAVLVAEGVGRWIDGHRYDSVLLRPRAAIADRSSGKWQQPEDVKNLVESIPVANGVKRAWFGTPLPRPSGQPDSDLTLRAQRHPGAEIQANYEWNRKYVERTMCSDQRRRTAVFDKLDDVYVFDPVNGDEHPAFRFLRNVTYPSGLQTNDFGWRGSNIGLDKPSDTIRLAFIGASTTIAAHSDPYSYPELVGEWLNRWAAETNSKVRFEVLNAAREGTNTESMRAIVQHELLPLEPDLVWFYEGSNHFWPMDFVEADVPERPLTHVIDNPGWLARRSAIAARLRNLFLRGSVVGEEPEKPFLEVHWPAELDEFEPDVRDRRFLGNLRDVLDNFDHMRETLEATGAQLALTSFTWLVYDGMRIDPQRDAGVFRFLNETYWPFSYAHLRRYLDFQNRVYRGYAELHDLPFFDYDRVFPREPRVFLDAIHLSHAGTRLQAWVMLQGLIPVIEARLASGVWPRPDRVAQDHHPTLSNGRTLVPVRDLLASCAVQDGLTSKAH